MPELEELSRKCAAATAATRRQTCLEVGRKAAQGDLSAVACVEQLEQTDAVSYSCLGVVVCHGRGAEAYPYLLRLASSHRSKMIRKQALRALCARLRQSWCGEAWAQLKLVLDDTTARSDRERWVAVKALVDKGRHRAVCFFALPSQGAT